MARLNGWPCMPATLAGAVITGARSTFDTDTAHVNYFTLAAFLESADATSRMGWFGERAMLAQQVEQQQLQQQQQSRHRPPRNQQQPQQSAHQQQPAPAAAQYVSPLRALRDVCRVLDLIARSPDSGAVVAVMQDAAVQQQPQQQPPPQRQHDVSNRSLQVLGLSPSRMVEAVTRSARATILAGGTLQPFQLLQMELLPSYPKACSAFEAVTRYRNSKDNGSNNAPPPPLAPAVIVEVFDHVVSPTRFQVFALGSGPDAAAPPLRFTRAASDRRDAMLGSVALVVLNLSRVVPRGLVVFFPSFAMEDAFFAALRAQGLAAAIEEKKKIFREARGGGGGGGVAAGDAALNGDALFAAYAKHIDEAKCAFPDDHVRGALLVSVMGGKLSEGINFCDDLGRCVVVVGMPYPNLGDPKLQLKLASLRGTTTPHAPASTTTATATTTAAPGAVAAAAAAPVDWSKKYYDALCMRSVNQSIGRCMRHINDYAIVVLLDERYNEVRTAQQLPKWMHSRVLLSQQFGDVMRGARDFFKTFVA